MDKPRTEFKYDGEIYIRPCGRGIILVDVTHEPFDSLEDCLPAGEYCAEIRIRKIKKKTDESCQKF